MMIRLLVLLTLIEVSALAQLTAVHADDVVRATDIMDRRVRDGKAVYFADEINIPANQTMVIDEPATIYTHSLKLEKNAVIDSTGHKLEMRVEDLVDSDSGILDVSYEVNQDASGQDGPSGVDGSKAADALKGGTGASGSNATSGVDGGDGASISIITPYLKGNVILVTRGGDGGRGGNGGDGGRGGKGFSGMDARILYHFKGMDGLPIDTLLGIGTMIGIPYVGQVLAILSIFNGIKIGDGFDGFDGGRGGHGGNAGNGGNGGSGGPIELVYGKQIEGTKIFVNTRGGKGAAGGRAGLGGVGGEGGEGGQHGDIWARDGKPGKTGLPGDRGLDGLTGRPGKAGAIKVTETSDPQWLTCYVRYKQLLDLGEDREFARDQLMLCSRM
jgi:hypothetical protein